LSEYEHAASAEATASTRHLLGTAVLLVVLFAGSLRLFEFTWDRDALADITRQPGGWIGAIVIAAGSAVVHELLHGFAWHAFAGVPWQSISLQPTWRVMGFVARPNVAIPVPAFRAGTALPALVLGVIPVVLGLLTDSGLLVLWGQFFFLECFADLAVLFAIHDVPSLSWARDHPTRLGCVILPSCPTTKVLASKATTD
jgi:hypothetical protein